MTFLKGIENIRVGVLNSDFIDLNKLLEMKNMTEI